MKTDFGRFVRTMVVAEDEPIVAWRSWTIGTEREFDRRCYRRVFGSGQTRLLSTVYRNETIWEPHEPLVAECKADMVHPGARNCPTVLREECTCGIWGCKSLANLVAHGCSGMYPTAVTGRVRLWGYIHEYVGGYRASAASIVDLWLGNRHAAKEAQELSEIYGVEVSTDVPSEILALNEGMFPVAEDADAAAGTPVDSSGAEARITILR